MKRVRIVFILFFFLLCLKTKWTVANAAESFELHVLDVGQGQCVFVKMDDRYLLFDGGGRAASSFVISYLKQQKINKLDYVAISHYDEDHMSGIIGVLNVFPCDTLLVPGYVGEGDLYQSLAVAALSNGCTMFHPNVGTSWDVGTGNIQVLCPIRDDYGTDNDMSLGFRIGFGDIHCLICGDAEKSSEIDMVNSEMDLSGDLYIVDHHGSSTSSMDSFLDAMNPSYAIISCGKDNEYGHPSIETMLRLQNHKISVFRTDEQGTIIAYSDGNDIWFNVAASEYSTPGNYFLIDENGQDETTKQIQNRTVEVREKEDDHQYVCNTNTKKFHNPDCNSVNQIKEENKLVTDLDRDELIAQGYEPCGSCKP